ncbi:hypothetical protein B0H17DRAFT_1133463 [Mycena rosella]|uniref:Uncharacterized protein n=1 Tax=Mycena rosella TaxID=1033263 RepID=A0AAD7DKX8_MYCRO|nr:hypothetical protein B0H17DRAFT_1133463 [Mycena rosella]
MQRKYDLPFDKEWTPELPNLPAEALGSRSDRGQLLKTDDTGGIWDSVVRTGNSRDGLNMSGSTLPPAGEHQKEDPTDSHGGDVQTDALPVFRGWCCGSSIPTCTRWYTSALINMRENSQPTDARATKSQGTHAARANPAFQVNVSPSGCWRSTPPSPL